MRKIIFALLLLTGLLAIPYITKAQNETPRLGIRGGLSLTNLYTDKADDQNIRPGLNVGLAAEFPIGQFFAIRPEILYSGKGMQADYNVVGFEGTQRFSLHYLELPAVFVLKAGKYVELHGGVYSAYLLGANVETTGDINSNEELNTDNFERFDWGLAVGGQLNFTETFGMGIRYHQGLKRVAKTDAADAFLGDGRNSALQLYLSIGL